jgi:hypothetical protein
MLETEAKTVKVLLAACDSHRILDLESFGDCRASCMTDNEECRMDSEKNDVAGDAIIVLY